MTDTHEQVHVDLEVDEDVALPDFDDDEDEDYDDIVRAKWSIDGATTLEEAADKLESLAVLFRYYHELGFRLRVPIDSDYGFVYHPGGRTLDEVPLLVPADQ